MANHAKPSPGINARVGKNGKTIYQVRYYNPTGERHAESFSTKTAAKAFKATMEADKHRGNWIDPTPAKVSFAQWSERYMTEKLSIRPRTVEKYESALHKHLVPAFGSIPIGALTRAHVQAWIADMDRDGLAPETIRNHYSLMAAMMKRAAAVGAIPKTGSGSV